MRVKLFRHVLAALASLLLPLSVLAAKGDRFPAEHRILKDAETGLSYVQLTSHAADDAVLYFTGPADVPADNGLVFASRRWRGAWNLFYMNLDTFEFVQLTDTRSMGGPSSTLAPKTREVFYREGRQIRAVHLDTLVERAIVELPEGFNQQAALSVTEDGQTLAFGLSQNIVVPSQQPGVIYSDMDERFAMRPESFVFMGRADGKDWRAVARQHKWISHVMVNPRDSGAVLYCHEGHWQRVEQRMWLVQSDDTLNRALRPEESPAVRIGHEYWFADGWRVGYHGVWTDGRPFIGVADLRSERYAEYETPEGNGHTHANAEGNLFVGDGSEKKPYLSLYALKDGKLLGRKLLRHDGSFANQEWHPHPRFLADGQRIVFTSNRAGNGDIYLVRVP